MMIEERVSKKQFVPDPIANLKVKGSEEFVARIVDILQLRLAAQPTGAPEPNDREPGVHQFLIVTKGGLDMLEGLDGG